MDETINLTLTTKELNVLLNILKSFDCPEDVRRKLYSQCKRLIINLRKQEKPQRKHLRTVRRENDYLKLKCTNCGQEEGLRPVYMSIPWLLSSGKIVPGYTYYDHAQCPKCSERYLKETLSKMWKARITEISLLKKGGDELMGEKL